MFGFEFASAQKILKLMEGLPDSVEECDARGVDERDGADTPAH